MEFPRFWWMLALATLGQGIFFAIFSVVRWRGNGVQNIPRPALPIFAGGACAGLAYGMAQSDPVFIGGQLCMIIIVSASCFGKNT